MKALLVLLTCLLCVHTMWGQTTQRCSQVAIESLSQVEPGNPLVLTAHLKDVSSSQNVNYKWKVSAGTIVSGEGTPTITLDTTGLAGISITATIDAITVENACSGSRTVQVAPGTFVCGIAFDEYGDVNYEDEKARLDNFAIQLQNDTNARGAILVFAGNPTYKGEASDRLRRAKNYIVKVRGIRAERLIAIDSGYRNELTTKLYIVPSGATVPALESESLSPHEIRFTKRRPRSFKR